MGNTTTNPSPPVEIINRKELRARLGISEGQAIKLGRTGVIKSFRLGHAVRYNWQQVISDLEKAGNTGGTRKY